MSRVGSIKFTLVFGFVILSAFLAAVVVMGLWGEARSGSGLLTSGQIMAILALAGLCAIFTSTMLALRALNSSVALLVEVIGRIQNGDMNAKAEGNMPREMLQVRDAVRNMLRALKERVGRAESVVKNLPMPFLMMGEDERCMLSNQACLDMLELDGPVERQYGRTLAEIFYNDASRKTLISRCLQYGDSITNQEFRINGHKGRDTDVLGNLYPLEDLDGNRVGAFGIYIDVSQAKQQERQILEQHAATTVAAEHAGRISQQAAAASEELSTQVEQTTAGTRHQRERTQEAVTAMEQMSVSIIEIARNAGLSAENAKDAWAKAENGRGIMDNALAAMAKLREQSGELKASLGSLGRHAEGIGSVMEVISDIADQTNLLALNAAIEAARAGDAGRGFAVVADEVRKLAEKTTGATKEVGDAVDLIQKETAHNIQTMDVTLASIDESSHLAEQAGSMLCEIENIVSSTAEQITSMATASEEQSAAVEEISQSMDAINTISGETAEAMEQASQAVVDLSQLAQELNTVIDELSA